VRQGVVTEADLHAEARSNVPVVHHVSRRSLVYVVADGGGLELTVSSGQAHEDIHEAVVGELAEVVGALLIAEQLLVLGVAVVAEAILHGVLAHGVGNVDLGLVVTSGIVPRGRTGVFRHAVRANVADARQRVPLDGEARGDGILLPSRRELRIGAVGDVDDVAVVVDAGFDEQVGINGSAQLDGGGIRGVRQGAGDGVVAGPEPSQEGKRRTLRHRVLHVVAEDLPLVAELVVNADDSVMHIDGIRSVGDVAVDAALIRLGNGGRLQVEHAVVVEQLVGNHG